MRKNTKNKRTQSVKSKKNLLNLKPRIKQVRKKSKKLNSLIPKTWSLHAKALSIIKNNFKVFAGLIVIYLAFYYLFLADAGSPDLASLSQQIDVLLGDQIGRFAKTVALGSIALSSALNSQGLTLLYFWAITSFSLVIIWAVRHTYQGKKFNLRDALYRGLEPFIPYLIISIIIALEFLPFLVGASVYVIVQSSGIAVTNWENLIFLLFWLANAFITAYLVTNSLMASYAVTLPGMYPIDALRATKEKVKGRRWIILRRILGLFLVVLPIFVFIFLFIVAVKPNLAIHAATIMLILTIVYTHTYLFVLYRELV